MATLGMVEKRRGPRIFLPYLARSALLLTLAASLSGVSGESRTSIAQSGGAGVGPAGKRQLEEQGYICEVTITALVALPVGLYECSP